MEHPSDLQAIKDRDDLSQRLAEHTPLILDLWEQRVRHQLVEARSQEVPALRDHLPVLLLRLAHALSPLPPDDQQHVSAEVSEQHGRERAWVSGYSLAHVLREYSLLREVVLEVLEGTGPVPRPEREQLHRFLDRAMEAAAMEFARVQQEALHHSQAQYRHLVDANIIGVILADTSGRILQANDAFLGMLGYTRPEFQERGVRWDEITPEEWRTVDESAILQLRASGAVAPFEKEFFGRDGTRLPVLIGVALVDATEETAICFVLDLSERKRLEAELEARAALLAEADRKKNEFLAMLAHEMRSPISAITNAVYLLEGLELPGDRAPRQLGAVSRQARHLARLAEDLLDVARITQGMLELRKERLDLVRVAREAAQTCLPLAESRGQDLRCDLHPEALWANVDPMRMEQVVINLLNNAVRYTEAGGSVSLTVEREENWALLRVQDTGLGIDAVMLPQIFDLFMQVAPGADRSQEGLGIGLTLVRRLVEMHGGSVTAQSPGVGQGSEFVVRLPLASSGAQEG